MDSFTESNPNPDSDMANRIRSKRVEKRKSKKKDDHPSKSTDSAGEPWRETRFLGLPKCNPQPKWHLDRFRRFGTGHTRAMGDRTNIAHRPSTHARHAVAMRTVR